MLGDIIKKSASKNKSSGVMVVCDPNKIPELLDSLKKGLPENVSFNTKSLPKDVTNLSENLYSDFKLENIIYSKLVENLKIFKRKVKEICGLLMFIAETSTLLTRRKITESMWGAKTMQDIMNKIRGEMFRDSKLERVELLNELMEKSIDRLISKLSTDLESVNEKVMVSNMFIPDVINGYEELKSLMLNAAVNSAALVYIDESFRKQTSYPAEWFLDPAVLEAFDTGYDTLLGYIMAIPKIEEKVIDPLDFVKFKILQR
jgi:hypothetical protein